MKIFIITIFIILFNILLPISSQDQNIHIQNNHIIIIINSYNNEQVCGELQKEGILSLLKNYKGIIFTYYFKSKSYNVTEYQRNYAADEIYLNIKNLQKKYIIDAIYVTDDNAFKYILIEKILKDNLLNNKKLLVSGINKSIKSYEKEFPILNNFINKNLYIVEETINFNKLFNFLLCNSINEPIYFLYDNTITSKYVLKEFKKSAENFNYAYEIYYKKIISKEQLNDFLNSLNGKSIIISNLFVLQNIKTISNINYIEIMKILNKYTNKNLIISFNPIGDKYINLIISPNFKKAGMVLSSIFLNLSNTFKHILQVNSKIYLNVNYTNNFYNITCVNKYVDILIE